MTYQFFEELLFGQGFWLGFFIIMAIAFVVSSRVKHSAIIFITGLLFLAMEYYENLSGSSTKIWGLVMCIVGMLILFYIEFHQVKGK